MPTLSELRDEHRSNVTTIREEYHDQGVISHTEYHQRLASERERFRTSLMDNGFVAEVYPLEALTHWARVSGLNPQAEKPLTVNRRWHERDVSVDCFVTQDLVDVHQAGNLAVGDYVLVVFVGGELDKPLATQKVYKSW